MEPIKTKHLIIRPFSPEDWQGALELSINKMSPKRDPNDHDLPTDEEGCRQMVGYFVEHDDQFFAVCLKDGHRLIGFLAFNGVDDDGQLDLGHVIHTEFQNNHHDTEALEAAIQLAFNTKEIRSIVTRNPLDWEEQVAPLKTLGLKPNTEGELAINKAEWVNR